MDYYLSLKIALNKHRISIIKSVLNIYSYKIVMDYSLHKHKVIYCDSSYMSISIQVYKYRSKN